MKKIILFTYLIATLCYAHKLNLFTTYENNTLFINSYFGNAKGCVDCQVIIKDINGKILSKLKTNKQGTCEFVTKPIKLSISVDTLGGHKVEKIINLKNENITKNRQKASLLDSSEIIILKKENAKLKNKIKLLEKQLSYLEIFKILFGLLLFLLIFLFLKKVKK